MVDSVVILLMQDSASCVSWQHSTKMLLAATFGICTSSISGPGGSTDTRVYAANAGQLFETVNDMG